MEIAKVLLVAHSSNYKSHQREGGSVRVHGQLWTAEVGRGLSLDLQRKG